MGQNSWARNEQGSSGVKSGSSTRLGPQTVTITLAGDLVVARAPEIHSQLLDAMEHSESVLIDCSQTTAVDVSFLQILIAAQQAAATRSRSVSLLTSSKAIETAIEAGGFARHIIPRGEVAAAPEQPRG